MTISAVQRESNPGDLNPRLRAQRANHCTNHIGCRAVIIISHPFNEPANDECAHLLSVSALLSPPSSKQFIDPEDDDQQVNGPTCVHTLN